MTEQSKASLTKPVGRVTKWLLAVAGLGAFLSAASGLYIWWAFLIVGGAIAVNGWFATLEDDLPGGFNNPEGNQTPRYAAITSVAIRGLAVVLIALCAGTLALAFFGSR